VYTSEVIWPPTNILTAEPKDAISLTPNSAM
jgi:hypothetical protein